MLAFPHGFALAEEIFDISTTFMSLYTCCWTVWTACAHYWMRAPDMVTTITLETATTNES